MVLVFFRSDTKEAWPVLSNSEAVGVPMYVDKESPRRSASIHSIYSSVHYVIRKTPTFPNVE